MDPKPPTPTTEQQERRAGDDLPGVTMVLGGGGARGLAHFGVLEVFDEAGIPIDAIVGNSAGALAGAVYLQAGGGKAAAERVLEFLSSPAFRRHGLAFQLSENGPAPTVLSKLLSGWRKQVAMHLLFRRRSLFHSRRLRSVLDAMVDDVPIEDLPRPLRIVAIDLEEGDEVVLERGELVHALLASCSVAGFFPPVEAEGRSLIDAGQADNLPVQVGLEHFQRPIVAVNLGAQIERRRDFATGIELMVRAEEIGSRWNTRLRVQDADVHIAPELDGRYWLDFSAPERAVRAGIEAAQAALEDVQRVRERAAQHSPVQRA